MLINGQIYLHFQEMSSSYYRCNYNILLAVPNRCNYNILLTVPRPMLNNDINKQYFYDKQGFYKIWNCLQQFFFSLQHRKILHMEHLLCGLD